MPPITSPSSPPPNSGHPSLRAGPALAWPREQIAKINRQVYHNRDDDYEYERDARGERVTWHQICWRHHLYRDLDPETGEPVAGSEGEWRLLQ